MSTSLFAEPRRVTKLDDCLFYHTVDVPGHGTIPGYWDIRGHESQYLGDVSFKGKRVLEIGPASGLLSFFMERCGAEVVSVEAAEDYPWEFYWDLPDTVPEDCGTRLEEHRAMMQRLKNSYWFCHRAFSSKARVHYGSAYHLPPQLGEFDISVMACILLHNKNPLHILENCARVTRETIIIVEPLRDPHPPMPCSFFLPVGNQHTWDTWWGFTPDFFTSVLRTMGFSYFSVNCHTQQCFGEPNELFTVVASRAAWREMPNAEGAVSVKISSSVERLKIEAGGLTELPLKITNLSETPLSPFSTSPVLLSYHWRDASGTVVVWDGMRTPLPHVVRRGAGENITINVQAPAEPGAYLLEVTMLKEGVKWYDDELPGLPLQITATVTR